MNFVVVDEFQGKFVPAVSKFSHRKRWCTIKVDVFLLISPRWRTSRGSMRSVLEPMALICSKMGDCVGCRWPPKFSWFDFPSHFPSEAYKAASILFILFIQIATKHKIYLFDILLLGARAFKNGLSQILGNKHILKVSGGTWQGILPSHTNGFYIGVYSIFGTDHSQLPSHRQ